MGLASIELRYLAGEIGRMAAGYYVSNIYGITRDSLLFKLHHPEKQDVFVMLSTSGIWATSRKIDPVEPNRMLRRLRGDLLRARVLRVEQAGAERIVRLTFQNFEKEFVLVAELFGDGNLVLCNSDMKILALLHSIDVRHRRLSVGLRYALPPSNSLDVFGVRREDFDGISGAETEAVRWLGRSMGFPKKYAEEVFHRAGVDPGRRAGSLSGREVDGLFNATGGLVRDIVGGNHRCVIVRRPGEPPEAYPVRISAPGGGAEAEPAPSFMEGLDRIFTEGIVGAGRAIRAGAADKRIREYQVQLEEQSKATETVKRRAAGITAAAKAVMGMAAEGILSIGEPGALERLGGAGADLVSHKGATYVQVLDQRIGVDPGSPLQAVASALFDEAKRQSGAVGTIEEQMRRTERMIARLRNRSDHAAEPAGFREIAKRAWFQRYRWFFTSDGMMAVGGRDSSSNSAVVRKHMEKGDRVFHAEVFGSPFFILKGPGGATASGLAEVAHATVCFSRAWRGAMHGTSAYWVGPDQVKRAAPSGQFLPKGSFIVEGRRNFVRVPSLKLAVGILRYNEGFLLVCGPPGPVRRQCACYAVIEPAGGDMAGAAKRIRAEFLGAHEEVTKPIPLDEFVRVLPAGGSHITESGDGENAGVR